MNISSTQLARPKFQVPSKTQATTEAAPQAAEASQDSVTFGSKLSVGETIAAVGIAGGMGAVSIGGTAALGMGSVKSFMSGNILLGIGLGAAAAVAGPTVGLTGLGLAAMTTDGGDNTGMMLFGAGALVATTASALAIFG